MATSRPTSAGKFGDRDIMNDPSYDNAGDDGMGEADTCRICRAEATEQEPLFYPCKCSGSIKFVHQDCLMEWLSHSQKKHCELCKTSFRFTKLYSPQMPQELPARIFLQRLAIHGLKYTETWVRMCLVAFVWLGWLPWAMRGVWRMLFWFADGGWLTTQSEGALLNSPIMHALALAEVQLANITTSTNGTSPVSSSLVTNPTTPAAVAPVMSNLTSFFQPFSEALSVWYRSGLHIHMTALSRSAPGDVSVGLSFVESNISQPAIIGDYPSLLSNVTLLHNLTRSPSVNNLIISVLEGQIITILVVVCFILVFLIREWVVQQQPGINVGAGFNAEFAVPAQDAQDDFQIAPLEQPRRNPDAPRPIARPRRRQVEIRPAVIPDADEVDSDSDSDEPELPEIGHRPTMPTRDALSPAAEIQRKLAEDLATPSGPPNLTEFLTIWRRSESSPERVLNIIREEGREEEFSYWIDAMKNLTKHDSPANSTGGDTWVEDDSRQGRKRRRNPIGGGSGSGYTSGSELSDDEFAESSASKKGKGKATDASSQSDQDENTKPLLPSFGSEHPGIMHPNVPWPPKPEVDTSDWKVPGTESTDFSFSANTSHSPALNKAAPLSQNTWSFSALPEDSTKTRENLWAQPRSSTPVQHDSNSRIAVDSKSNNPDLFPDDSVTTPTLPGIALKTNGSPPQHDADHSDTEAEQREWALAQDLRVQNAINKARVEIAARQNASNREFADQQIPAERAATPAADTETDGDPIHTPQDDEDQVIAPVPALPEPENGVIDRITNWMFGEIRPVREPVAGNDEHIVDDINAEAPFVPVNQRNRDDDVDPEAAQDPEVVAAALAAGLDPNDIDDAEDFDGIMELIGMRGPWTGLLQNGMFSAVLISLTVSCGVWLPYNIGRLGLILVANPISALKLPIKIIMGCAELLVDITLVVFGYVSFAVLALLALPKALISIAPAAPTAGIAWSVPDIAIKTWSLASAAGERISGTAIDGLKHAADSDIPDFSASSHEALINIKTMSSAAVCFVGNSILALVNGEAWKASTKSETWVHASSLLAQAYNATANALGALSNPNSMVINLELPQRTGPVDPALAHWGGVDRFWAIFAGYMVLTILGALYLRRGTPFSSGRAGQDYEAQLADILNQAGGVMKVILIISIEMLVFPLYCGLLLDIALLPLFDGATIMSRMQFTYNSPLTSIFVHWFVGTCYMFHFALFVSMCRKIMRKGVLYFIRDPDDPNFHPVRDVLERNVATQLRKITFSALVYGALVMVCLGGVVWGLALVFGGVLPIHWSSNEPVLEFPVDLLFYNFLMPLAVRFFKPSDGLKAMYEWWFRKCARVLRLTQFLFDKRRVDEEGRSVSRGWKDVFMRVTNNLDNPVLDDAQDTEQPKQFLRDGRFVRVPASDQVRIPKGAKVFLEVDENNERLDGAIDTGDGLHGRDSSLFKQVYVPPSFRARIFLFILSIWLFAAFTGVCITIVPLVFGRMVFAQIIPGHLRMNDVYAFSIGIYILGSALYCVLHLGPFLTRVKEAVTTITVPPAQFLGRATEFAIHAAKVFYFYSAVLIYLPSLLALILEFYLILPLHTYFSPNEPHFSHIIQSWTLGLLYINLGTKLILWGNSRASEALQSLTRNGYLAPDIRILTRVFVLPATILSAFLLLVPLTGAYVLLELRGATDETLSKLIYRFSFPAALYIAGMSLGAWGMVKMLRGCRQRIRDEVYLIGERLHNFGERKGVPAVRGNRVVN